MKYILIIIVVFYFLFRANAQTESALSNNREILMYSFQSKIFSELQGIILDTLRTKFDCNELDLVRLSIEDSIGCFNFSLTPVMGYIYTMFSEKDYDGKYEYGFQIENSGITYLFEERNIDFLKQLGHLRKITQMPFLPFIKELNNKCLNEDNKKYSEVKLTINVSYCFKNAFIIKSVSYYVRERNRH
jgi:hypothetical protein